MKYLKTIALWMLSLFSVFLCAASWYHRLPITLTEVLGFITGWICVWLTVEEHVLNWPVGIANSVFFVVLFWNARLFADMGLQVVYIVLGFLGWYWWLRGGVNNSELPISKVSAKVTAVLFGITIIATILMTWYLRRVSDAAPFWDAFTTVLSLVAQYLLTKKILENWYLWIAADVIYIALYFYKGLTLTALLYLIFLSMCIVGLKQWKQTAVSQSDDSSVRIPHNEKQYV